MITLGLPQTHERAVGSRTTMGAFALIMVVAAGLRLVWPGTRPGWDWDESVYNDIGSHVTDGSGVMLKTQFADQMVTYLSHPPFYFWLLGGWFKLFGEGVVQARLLSVTMSLVAIALLFFFLKALRGETVAIVGTALVAIDGWVVFTNRVSWIENTQLVLIVLALWAYAHAMKTKSLFWFGMAGTLVGCVVVFKHIGVYVLLAVLINWIIQRQLHRGHGILLRWCAYVILLYVAWMTLATVSGSRFPFLDASWAQVQRMVGGREARGTVVSLGDAVGAAFHEYSIFAGSVLVALAGVALLVARIAQCARKRSLDDLQENSLLFAFALAAVLFFGSISLKMPHYFELPFIALDLYFVSEAVVRWQRGRIDRKMVVGGMAVVVVLAGVAFVGRIVLHSDNATEQLAAYARSSLPADSVVIADETTGAAIPQRWCKPERTKACLAEADFVITYTSRTQYESKDSDFQKVLAKSVPIATFKGFKETLTVLRIQR